MSLISRTSLLKRARRGRGARRGLVASHIDKGIAHQIKATREVQGLTQADLARQAEMSQNNISRLESPDYGKHTITSLKRIADALDVALVVRFVPFSQYIDWLSGTPRLDEGLSANSLAVHSFEQEEASGVNSVRGETQYWPVIVNSNSTVPTLKVTTGLTAGEVGAAVWTPPENGTFLTYKGETSFMQSERLVG